MGRIRIVAFNNIKKKAGGRGCHDIGQIGNHWLREQGDMGVILNI